MVINLSIDGLTAWLKSKNITAHTIAIAAVGFAAVYSTDQQVRDFVLDAFKNHPVILGDITFAISMILKYSHSSSAAGLVANAQSVEASPKPPSLAAVQAAQTDPTLPGQKPAQP